MKISDLKDIWTKYKLKKEKKIFIRRGVKFKGSIFEGYGKIGKKSEIRNCFIGLGTYLGKECSLNGVKIGRYCSIGDRVRVHAGDHPLDFISTHPAFYFDSLGISSIYFNRGIYFECIKGLENGYTVEIGNDVWIGSEVSIRGG